MTLCLASSNQLEETNKSHLRFLIAVNVVAFVLCSCYCVAFSACQKKAMVCTVLVVKTMAVVLFDVTNTFITTD